MTTNTYSPVEDKVFDFINKEVLERYFPVNVYNVQCCQNCGFEFCICKYIVVIILTEDTLPSIPINDKLKALGVTKFAKQFNVIDIAFKERQTVVFDIDPKKITKTRDNFEKEARRYPDLSKDTIAKVSLVLMDSVNDPPA